MRNIFSLEFGNPHSLEEMKIPTTKHGNVGDSHSNFLAQISSTKRNLSCKNIQLFFEDRIFVLF